MAPEVSEMSHPTPSLRHLPANLRSRLRAESPHLRALCPFAAFLEPHTGVRVRVRARTPACPPARAARAGNPAKVQTRSEGGATRHHPGRKRSRKDANARARFFIPLVSKEKEKEEASAPCLDPVALFRRFGCSQGLLPQNPGGGVELQGWIPVEHLSRDAAQGLAPDMPIR